MQTRSPVKGFTLVEVLIAATILFTVVATVSQVYRGATVSSIKASRAVQLSAIVPLLMDTISFRLKQADVTQPLTQQGVLNDFEFNWTARVIEQSPPPPRFDLETDSYSRSGERFYLWQVQLILSKTDYSQQFEFTALSWKGL